MKKITKAVIPVAGFGTRFLPYTKAMPKEMLPIIDKPTIQYIVEEAVASGIEDILFITASHSNKRAIEDHFDTNKELEIILEEKGKTKYLEQVRNISSMANIQYVRQKEAKGLGHAIYCARSFIGDDDFAVLLGDDVVVSDIPATKQLINQYNKVHSSIIGVQEVAQENVDKYGIVDFEGNEDLSIMHQIVEKPSVEDAPSNKAVLGRYILTSKIFDYLETQEKGAGNEIQLTDAIKRMMDNQDVYSYIFSGRRYDIGDKLGYLEATVDFALQRDDLKDEFKKILDKRR